MFPLETLPSPGDPYRGVVYLRIVLSPQQASRMWMFRNISALQGRVVSTSPPSWRTTPRRLFATAYSIYSQLPSLSEAVPLSATWGRAMPWWQGPTTWPLYLLPSIIQVPTFLEYFQTPVFCSDENIGMRMSIEHRWNGTGRGNRSIRRESCPRPLGPPPVWKGLTRNQCRPPR